MPAVQTSYSRQSPKPITLSYSDPTVQIFDEWVEVTLPPTTGDDFDADKSFTLFAKDVFEVRVASKNMVSKYGASVHRNHSATFVCSPEGWVRQ